MEDCSTMIELSVVIVNYNVKSFLEQALLSIFKALEGIVSEVFVVDNGSGDGSGHLVRERFPQVHLIENRDNRGFARANNQALRKARGKTICLVNPDTLIREDTFRVCLDYLHAHPAVGAVGCKILNPDGSLQLSCRRSFPTPWVAFTKIVGLSFLFPESKIFGKYNLTYLDPDKTTEVDALSGSFMIVRKKTVAEVGLLDEAFFLYGEDLDWCYRIRQKGWKIVYLPETQIIHYKGQSTKEVPFNSLQIFYEAMHIFVKKHFRKGWSLLPMWFLLLGVWIRGGFSFLSRIFRNLTFPFVDAVFLQLGLALAIGIRFGHLKYWSSYRLVDGVYSLVWIGCLYIFGQYKKGIYSIRQVFGAVLFGLLVNTSFTFFSPQYAFSRQVVLTAGVLNALFLCGWRLVLQLATRSRSIPFIGTMGRSLSRRRTLIVGYHPSGQRVLQQLKSCTDAGYEVVGFVGMHEKDLLDQKNGKVPLLGTLNDLKRIALTHRIQEVIFFPEAMNSQRILRSVAETKDLHLDFKMVARNWELVIGRTSIDTLEDIPLIDLDYKIFNGPNIFFKRLMDLLVSVLLLPVWIPLLIYLSVHPSFHFRRIAISGGMDKALTIRELWKDGKNVKGFLGTISLYPEILLGRMSLVGTEMVPVQKSATVVGFKPGLTGLVQVNKKKHLKEEEKEKYTIYYLKNYSPLLDVEIILRTLFHL